MRLTIKKQLYILLIVMLGLMLVIGAMGFSGMRSSNNAVDTIYQQNLRNTQQLARLNEIAKDMVMELSLSAQHDPMLSVSALHDHPVQQHMNNIVQNLSAIDSAWHSFSSQPLSPEVAALADQFSEDYRQLLSHGIAPAMPLYSAGQYDAANEVAFTVALPAYRQMNGTLHSLIDLEEQDAQAQFASAESQAVLMRNLMIAALALALLLGGVLGWLLMQRITQPLAVARHHFHAMAKGDLSQPIPQTRRDEIGEMLLELALTQQKLQALIAGIQRSAIAISSASSQISSGNGDLSQRTEQQAASLQETAASMEQVAATVKNNTQHTGEANRLAHQATCSAQEGGQTVQQAVGKMLDLNESSGKITGIVAMIDGIAFQTNILALNASVEAARAGEQGRGFSVVAQEVRHLAQRSADAAKQIQALIVENDSIVQQSSTLVETVGKSMEKIVGNISHVSQLMVEVSRASDEQTSAIDQMSIAINQMDDVTHQNASLVAQTATASAEMEAQAAELSAAVSQFRLDDSSLSIANQSITNQSQFAHEPNKPLAKHHSTKAELEWEEF